MSAENSTRASNSPDDSTPLVNSDVVFKNPEPTDQQTGNNPCCQGGTISPKEREQPSTSSKTQTHGMQTVRQQFIELGISGDIANVLMCSWRSGTQKQYDVYIRKWHIFCMQEKINSMQPDVIGVLKFLHSLHIKNFTYSTLNTARSALSSYLMGFKFDGSQYGVTDHPFIIRYMKGIFNSHRPTPRYTETWDITPVLNYLELLFPLEKLALKDLSFKLVTLLALTTGQRCQTLTFLDTHNMKESTDSYLFLIKDHVKQDRPGKLFSSVIVRKYPKQQLCVYTTLRHYLARTQVFRNDDKTSLILSYVKPHNPVGSSSIGRWIKTVLCCSGIDTTRFKAHSTRAAATSKASQTIPVDQILQHIGWANEKTFQTFYNKPICNDIEFDKAVLN